jgi:predicted amidohydrolase
MNRTIRIAALQRRVGIPIPPDEFDRLREQGIELVCLPEYFFIPPSTRSQQDTLALRSEILSSLEDFSRRLQGIVAGGSLVEEEGGGLFAACHVFDRGRHIGFYRKMHPTDHERHVGIQPGNQPVVLDIRGLRLGLLICADVLFPDSVHALVPLKPDLIAIPTASPYRPNDTIEEKFLRDREIFLAAARITRAMILKTCGVGSLMGERLQGRSLICDPQGILTRIAPDMEDAEATLTALCPSNASIQC